jgi:hypothetical protein
MELKGNKMEELFNALLRWNGFFGVQMRLVLYSDGSGHVEDDKKEPVFAFWNLLEFIDSNPAEIYKFKDYMEPSK